MIVLGQGQTSYWPNPRRVLGFYAVSMRSVSNASRGAKAPASLNMALLVVSAVGLCAAVSMMTGFGDSTDSESTPTGQSSATRGAINLSGVNIGTLRSSNSNNDDAVLIFVGGLAVIAYLEYSAAAETLYVIFVWLLYDLIWLATAATYYSAIVSAQGVRKGLCVAFVLCAMVIGAIVWPSYKPGNKRQCAGIGAFCIVALGLDVMVLFNGGAPQDLVGWIATGCAITTFYLTYKLGITK